MSSRAACSDEVSTYSVHRLYDDFPQKPFQYQVWAEACQRRRLSRQAQALIGTKGRTSDRLETADSALAPYRYPVPGLGGKAARIALPDDPRMLEHVDAIGMRQGESDVLLAEQHGDRRSSGAGARAPSTIAPGSPARARASAHRGSGVAASSSARARWSASAARRPKACPPSGPGAAPGSGTGRRAIPCAPCSRRAPACWPPRSRFSRTVMSPNSSRPSGHCTMPPRAIVAAGRARRALCPRGGSRPNRGARPEMALNRVVLPAPFSPTTETNSP